MSLQLSGHHDQRSPAKARTVVTIEVSQDRLLREAVRLIETAKHDGHWTWSWLSKETDVSTTTILNWRNKKTKTGLTRTMNSALKAIGYRLVIGKMK